MLRNSTALKADRPSAVVVWATATLFVTIVSCCSLIGVSIMPLISGQSYKVFITLFTGLAVGSLVGSAIFSLIPQAFNLQVAANEHAHLYKALVIFVGIYLFYCSERVMRLYFERRTRRRLKKHTISREAIAEHKSPDENNDNRYTADAKATIKTDINEIEIDLVGPSGDEARSAKKDVSEDKTHQLLLRKQGEDTKLEASGNSSKTKSDLQPVEAAIALGIHQHHHHHHVGHSGMTAQEEIVSKLKDKTVVVSRQEIAPVAWMIIIGDGLHNFIDGLSIGAAFSETILFGISTSVAVICEEFPHELGDFAVLISSGMTVRQALGYNFLSACTCYLGMIIGIIVGSDTTQSASYIFALAGGMFLYIALVDMMGELSASLDVPNQSLQETVKFLIMQNIGILTGIVIIFLLSMIDVSADGSGAQATPLQ